MTEHCEKLKRLIRLWDGQVEPAAALEALLSSNQDLTDLDALAMAAAADFGDVVQLLAGIDYLAPDRVSHLVHRLGWIVYALTQWDPKLDRRGLRVEAASRPSPCLTRERLSGRPRLLS
ncbi:hypothetical protein [Mesorhizobium captivum]|uniref:hypothetical protein n=1 Tax=Mesorhizobium captivum TaxID=3072319 RepID=UPI002A23AE8F|nr:hypothetical protein [Mesorhizobium sp. VK3C]MDX8450808.1 hypothetical protein [Mesorhizobium sp. VK3C]